MPYLQLDTPFSYSAETKQRLAKRLGEIYAEKMNSSINRISVAIRQLDEGGLWRCGEGDPRPASQTDWDKTYCYGFRGGSPEAQIFTQTKRVKSSNPMTNPKAPSEG